MLSVSILAVVGIVLWLLDFVLFCLGPGIFFNTVACSNSISILISKQLPLNWREPFYRNAVHWWCFMVPDFGHNRFPIYIFFWPNIRRDQMCLFLV